MMTWVTFSRYFPEDGADWLDYWRSRGTPRPECNFTSEADLTVHAQEVGPPNRRWVHLPHAVTWTEVST